MKRLLNELSHFERKRQGRATFLPLTTIKPRQLSGQQVSLLESSEGFLGLASDLVTYQPNLDAIFQNLLGTIAILIALTMPTRRRVRPSFKCVW